MDGKMVATLTGEQCTKIADELLLAADVLTHSDGGTDDDELRCPRCGTKITTITQDFDMVKLAPCGHEIAADHPYLQKAVGDEDEDEDGDN